MRYQLNEKILAIGFYHESDEATKMIINSIGYVISTPHLNWKFKIIELEVIEHHKVGDANDTSENPEKKYDGYILTADGVSFRNQYPHASYGQISDTADRVFRVVVEPGKLPQAIEKHKAVHYHLLSEQYEFLKDNIHRDREPVIVEGVARLIKEIDQEIATRFSKKLEWNCPYPDIPEIKHYGLVSI